MAAPPDRIAFSNGRIITMYPALPSPDVVVIEHGRIAAVGERAFDRLGCSPSDLLPAALNQT